MTDRHIIGSCSRCGGVVLTDPSGPGSCLSCKGRARTYGPVIEVAPPEDTRQLLTETHTN